MRREGSGECRIRIRDFSLWDRGEVEWGIWVWVGIL